MKNVQFRGTKPMLFISNKDQTLKDIVFNNHLNIESDELNILTGYVGSSSIEGLMELDLSVNVIYGLAKQVKLNQNTYDDLCNLSSGNISIYCPEILSHAKIYIWKYEGRVVYVLNGSANFSASGLETPFKEILSEVDHNLFTEFENYYNTILNSSVLVNEVDINKFGSKNHEAPSAVDPNVCLSDSLFGEASKINWGHGNAKNHPRDAYISVTKRNIENHPTLFPEKASDSGLGYPDNEPIDILWDDGERMTGLLEGSQIINGLRFPNKISSFKSKKILGDYLRKRLGLLEGEFVREQDFDGYGRDNVSISLISEGSYFMDFRV